ncbi:glutathione S-transferase C-terminal domain-containing protein homolog [Aricia agestis]|uniref:glutathione S-transferase C-terminal domain-containing protein homolog n=1 Tax=Aricia agestis TaxID=91739 RepID=UPI001C204FE0|nr:glutathione S-transferase C-terminal domain-containing protein homolog [Aricia agestis]
MFLYLETFTSYEDYKKSKILTVPLESLIAYYVYKYCQPTEIGVYFVYNDTENRIESLQFCDKDISFKSKDDIPWQVASCLYPVVLNNDTIVTGLCAVSRHICKHKTSARRPEEHEEGLLGFRKGCLQAPNEASIWTKFCEIDILKSVTNILTSSNLKEVPINLIRFENHLNKPVKVHNVYKLARDIKKENQRIADEVNANKDVKNEARVPKQRKWKSKSQKEVEVDCCKQIQDLNISHQFAEGPFLTLADLVLLPSYYILFKLFGHSKFQVLFPLTHEWFQNITSLTNMKELEHLMSFPKINSIDVDNLIMPKTDDVSLYKSDPKRHNPKKRLFTKPEDIENALNVVKEGMELELSSIDFDNDVNWSAIPDGANPFAGHLPDSRNTRKSQQLENLTLAALSMAKDKDIIVDFCSGSGHLGILIAYLLPKTTVILLENKQQSLLRARERVYKMDLKNVYFFQCNLDFFIGKFDIGIALHACGIASDLVLDKCLKAGAKFVICPCCYGSLHATDRLVYPRSLKFKHLNVDQYLCIGHTADQTHKDHPLTVRGARCMAVIDSDRARLAEEFGYKVTLSRLKPLSCSDKNNLLIGVPS